MIRTLLVVLLVLMSSISCRARQAKSPLLEQLKAKVADKTYPKIDAILVEQGNQLLVEEYFGLYNAEQRHDTRSAFKSITSLLAGIAIDQGLLRLQDPLQRFFPELAGNPKGEISLQNLLEMRSGLNCEEFYDIGPECEGDMVETDDWIAFCLHVELKSQPGLNWSYNSNEPMLVGEVISRASGMTIMDFARQYLFAPMGIEDYEWTISPRGRGMTAGSFFMTPADMLKIARLVAQKGNWQGTQLVSKDWIDQSTDCGIVIDFSFLRYSRMANARYESARYGFFWYRELLQYEDISTEVLFASGNGGQYMMLLPDYDARVVFTGSNYGNWRGKLPFELLLKYIVPMLGEPSK